jgi:hypothetical protein
MIDVSFSAGPSIEARLLAPGLGSIQVDIFEHLVPFFFLAFHEGAKTIGIARFIAA